jgi:hypothetical protein
MSPSGFVFFLANPRRFFWRLRPGRASRDMRCRCCVFEPPLLRNAKRPKTRQKKPTGEISIQEGKKASKGRLKKEKEKEESVGCFYVGLRFFGLFCKMSLRVILTPPARYQHPHDANNPQVGRWGNCKPRWWPQGSSFSSSKTKQRTPRQTEANSTGW